MTSLKGRLLVANPAMSDPNFHRTVVLLLAHQDDGALGVVLNRPSELDVDSPLPQWEPLVADPPVVFVGGPVAPGAAICLARVPASQAKRGWGAGSGSQDGAGSADGRGSDSGGGPGFGDGSGSGEGSGSDDGSGSGDGSAFGDRTGGWLPLIGELGTLDLEKDPDDLAIEVEAIRVFAGYAGWGPRQLEGEIESGAWFVVPSEAADALAGDPQQLWKRVLRRQGGRLALVAAYPTDPSLN